LSHWQNFFSFGFSALSFTDASTNRYRYKMESLDRDWAETTSDARIASYTAVPPGDYVFRVQGATSRSQWSEPGIALHLTVLPPWWSTLWFRLTLAISVALIIVFLHRLQVRQATERLSMRFDERLAERTRIARELHDTLLQSLHGLLLRFQAVQNLLPERPVEAKASLEIAINRAADAVTQSRDAVHELRGRNSDGKDLVARLTSLGEDLAADYKAFEGDTPTATFRVLVEGKAREISRPLNEDLYQIAKEAIVNAFRHAHAKQIELDLKFGPRMLRLRVRDDGLGIDRNVLPIGLREGHWGFPGMRERAKAIGAALEVWSELNRGTEVELTIPAALAYESSKHKGSGTLDEEKASIR
jgi:signal transduction histidine kinase